jgi:hypothetical protein
MMEEEAEITVEYEIWQNDELVASSSDLTDAHHYAMIYSQNGPVRLVEATTHRRQLSMSP